MIINEKKSDSFNLLQIRPIRTFVEWKGFPYVFQLSALIILVSLAIFGWQIVTPEKVNDKLFAKTNLVTLVIWGIWWPMMVWVAVLFGRAWCIICPLELVSNFSERMGKALGITQKKLNKFLRSGAIIVALYALLQLLVATIHLHRMPAYTAFFLISLLFTAFFSGLFFKDRAFCRGFCPVSFLLNAYGRGSMLRIRISSQSICDECSSKECINSSCRYKLDGRSCPSLLNPPKLNSNKDCLVCGQCIKSCKKDNVKLMLNTPFSEESFREERAGYWLTIFIMMVSGFVTYELASESIAVKYYFLYVPSLLTSALRLDSFSGFINGLWTIFIFPLLIWTIFGLIYGIFKGSYSLMDSWQKMALPMAVIISAGHMTKAAAKLNSWLSFLPGSLNDPIGKTTALSIENGTLAPLALFSNATISFVGMTILCIAFYFSLREEELNIRNASTGSLFPKLLLLFLYLFIVYGWG